MRIAHPASVEIPIIVADAGTGGIVAADGAAHGRPATTTHRADGVRTRYNGDRAVVPERPDPYQPACRRRARSGDPAGGVNIHNAAAASFPIAPPAAVPPSEAAPV